MFCEDSHVVYRRASEPNYFFAPHHKSIELKIDHLGELISARPRILVRFIGQYRLA